MDIPKNEVGRELLRSQAHVLNHEFRFINSMILKCAIQLGIPDIIHNHGRPMTLAELVTALPINPSKAQAVFRLMRVLVHFNFFSKEKVKENDEEEGYSLTPASKLLLKDEPLSIRPFFFPFLDQLMIAPWHHMSEWFQNDDPTPFHTAYGRGLWVHATQEPRLSQLFNEAMASDALLIMEVLTKEGKGVFEGLNSLVDVGGGTGALAMALVDAFPNINITVLDLPHVVAGLQGNQNLSYVGGDMFKAIPSADAVLLKWILHNWNDDECIQILKRCKEAIPSQEKGGKVIVIDIVLENHKVDQELVETQLFFDMEMLIYISGRERTEKEWAKLFCEAGFSDYRIAHILGYRSLIEVYP